MSGLGDLPLLPASALPSDIRSASAEDQRTYRAAAGFEKVLLAQLTQTLVEQALPEDEEGSSVLGARRDMLGDTLADAIVSNGGTGLARDLFVALREDRA